MQSHRHTADSKLITVDSKLQQLQSGEGSSLKPPALKMAASQTALESSIHDVEAATESFELEKPKVAGKGPK